MCFDWDSFWVNVISDFAFFIVTLPLVIWFLPDIAVRLLRRKNKRYLSIKYSSILIELCEFITESPYRNDELNREQLAITTKQKPLKDFRFVALCNINVFNAIVYPKMVLVIHEYHQKLSKEESYKLITAEYDRLRTFRADIERILSAHSLYLDEQLVLQTSNLCFDIRQIEIKFKMNFMYDDVIKSANSERIGFFGLNELPKIYESTLFLIKVLAIKDYFEYKVETNS